MIHRGVVEANKKNGRVQVRVYGVHSQDTSLIPTKALPWAEVQGSTSFGLLDGVGVSSVLRIGTWVYVMFEGGDVDRPIVTGVVIGDDDIDSTVQDNYLDVQTLTTTSGHIIEISDVDGDERITVTHKSGSKVNIETDGKMQIDAVSDITISSTSKVDVNAPTINTVSTGATNVQAAAVSVTATGDATVSASTVGIVGSGVVSVTAPSIALAAAATVIGAGGTPLQIARLGDVVSGVTSDGASFTGTISACAGLNFAT